MAKHPAFFSSKIIYICLPLLILLLFPALGHSTVIRSGADIESYYHSSFVRDGTGRIVATDWTYAADLKKSFDAIGWASIDVVMQQCFGGGFGNDIANSLANQKYTFSSAAAWSEPALNAQKPPGSVVPTTLDNFTRAWREDARRFPASGMLAHFQAAQKGVPNPPANPPIAKDPFAPKSDFKRQEQPQYFSPDKPGSILNDNRVVGNEGGARQFVISVAWDEPDPRHAVNIVRLSDTLFGTYGVSLNTILYDNPIPNPANLGPFNTPIAPDTVKIGGDAINGNNSLTSWLKALNGDYWAGLSAPKNGDKLLIYNTGHGGHWKPLGKNSFGSTSDSDGDGIPDSVFFSIPIREGFAADNSLDGDMTLSDMFLSSITDVDIPDPDGNPTDLIQLAFTSQPDATALVQVNGQSFGAIGSYALGYDDPAIYPIEPFGSSENLFFYQLRVSHWLLGASPDLVNLQIQGLLDADSLFAVDFRGGDQEFLITATVPESSTFVILGIGILLLAIRKRVTSSETPE